jgi:catechol 2,3-dioxygenase
LPDETHVARLRLKTRNVKSLLRFYEEVLGFQIVRQEGTETELSADGKDPVSIVLCENAAANTHLARATGLFHLAIRYSTRASLAQACLQLHQKGYAIDGASDHIVSEAVYLRDSDGNGVELYADRPSSQWVWKRGEVMMATRALSLKSLLSSTGEGSTHPRAELGHLHLSVTDLAQSERFYREFLGLAVTQRAYPGALFFSAGGYHHHIAVNIWGSPAPATADSTGLVSYRLLVPVPEILYCLEHRAPLFGYEAEMLPGVAGTELLRVRDPNGNWLEVETGRN